jgi:hypothetical protein
MSRGFRTMYPQPSTLTLRHRIAAERSFTGETGFFEFIFPPGQDLNRALALASCWSFRKMSHCERWWIRSF